LLTICKEKGFKGEIKEWVREMRGIDSEKVINVADKRRFKLTQAFRLGDSRQYSHGL
jgi:hypothetical protein